MTTKLLRTMSHTWFGAYACEGSCQAQGGQIWPVRWCLVCSSTAPPKLPIVNLHSTRAACIDGWDSASSDHLISTTFATFFFPFLAHSLTLLDLGHAAQANKQQAKNTKPSVSWRTAWSCRVSSDSSSTKTTSKAVSCCYFLLHTKGNNEQTLSCADTALVDVDFGKR